MKRYGVEDLLKHVIYVNEKENLKPIERHHIHRVLFFVLGFCYRYGVNIKYDLIFEKTTMGAHSNYLDEHKYSKWKEVDFKKGLAINELIDNEKVNAMIVKTINLTNENPSKISEVLVSSNEYQKDIRKIKETERKNRLLKMYPYWTKKDISELFEADESIDRRNSIPVSKHEYKAVLKYLKYENNWDKNVSFTKEETFILHDIPSHRFILFEKFGIHLDE